MGSSKSCMAPSATSVAGVEMVEQEEYGVEVVDILNEYMVARTLRGLGRI